MQVSHSSALIAKTRISILLEGRTLKEVLYSLYDVIVELSLRTISVSKMDVDNVFWAA